MNGHHRRESSAAPPVPARRGSTQKKLIEKLSQLQMSKPAFPQPPTSTSNKTLPLPSKEDISSPVLIPVEEKAKEAPSGEKDKYPTIPTRHDTPCDFFIVVGLEKGQTVQENQGNDQNRVHSTSSQDGHTGYYYDTTSIDLLLPEQREILQLIR
jgi:hypothetical protein